MPSFVRDDFYLVGHDQKAVRPQDCPGPDGPSFLVSRAISERHARILLFALAALFLDPVV